MGGKTPEDKENAEHPKPKDPRAVFAKWTPGESTIPAKDDEEPGWWHPLRLKMRIHAKLQKLVDEVWKVDAQLVRDYTEIVTADRPKPPWGEQENIPLQMSEVNKRILSTSGSPYVENREALEILDQGGTGAEKSNGEASPEELMKHMKAVVQAVRDASPKYAHSEAHKNTAKTPTQLASIAVGTAAPRTK